MVSHRNQLVHHQLLVVLWPTHVYLTRIHLYHLRYQVILLLNQNHRKAAYIQPIQKIWLQQNA